MAVHLIKHTAPCACVVWRRKWWPHYFPLWCVHVVLVSVCVHRDLFYYERLTSRLSPTERLTQSRLHKSHAAQLHRWHAHNVPRMNLLACWVHVVHTERVLNTLGRCIVHFALISFAACSMCIRVFRMPCEYIYRNILWIQMKLLFCDSYTLITDMRYPIQEQHSRAPRVFMHINKTVSILL